jgi:acyl carrier protein
MTMNPSAPTREQIHEVLWRLAAERAGVNPAELRAESRLVQDLGLDSLDVAELAMELEEALHITLPNEGLEDLELSLGKLEEILGTR